MATVQLEQLCKRFGSYTALESLDLSIDDGEFLVLLGPSGCGKSTTMRLVAGLEEPTSGNILIDGERVNRRPARDRDLAMVFQNYALYPHMTVGENIGYPLKIQRIPKAQRQEQVNEAAARVELEHLLTRRPAELSGGQRQRVALARAIVRRPRLFLMDEPLSNLDAKLRTVMRAELKHLQRDLATTTIYVTHDQIEAMTLADRVVILNDAKIQQVGKPADIYASPANEFVAGFIGSPPMNLIRGEIIDNAFTTPDGAAPVLNQVPGSVTLGIRPEHISVVGSDVPGLDGRVYSSELLGDSTLLNVRVGKQLIAVKVGPEEGRATDEAVRLHCPPERLHFFDADTHQRRSHNDATHRAGSQVAGVVHEVGL